MIIIPSARRSSLVIVYNGKDISTSLAPYILSFSFSDNSKDRADDISLSLEDRAGLWLNDWTPTKGDSIQASILKYDDADTTSLPCGTFSIDQIDYSYPPAILTIKAVSSDIKASASQQKHSKSWENVTIRDIAADLAAANSLALFMSADSSDTLERIEQVEQSDLEFLQQLCADYGLAVKIQKHRLVIYDLEEFEAQEPVTSLSINDPRLLSFRFSTKSAKVYKKARVKYHHPVKDEDYEAEYEDDDEEGSDRVLEIRERVETQSQAETIAKERLIEANRAEVTGSIVMMGDVRLAAGVSVTLSEFGSFSGKHFVNKATHKVDSSGYTSTLELGMPKTEKGKSKANKKSKRTGKKKSTTSSEVFYEGDRYYAGRE